MLLGLAWVDSAWLGMIPLGLGCLFIKFP